MAVDYQEALSKVKELKKEHKIRLKAAMDAGHEDPFRFASGPKVRASALLFGAGLNPAEVTQAWNDVQVDIGIDDQEEYEKVKREMKAMFRSNFLAD